MIAKPWHFFTRRLRAAFLAPLIAQCLAGCASPGGSAPQGASTQEALTFLAEKNHVCAVALAVVRQGKLQPTQTASACAPGAALNADSVFQAASLSKPVFAYAVLKLVEQGRLTLDAPVMTYLPQGYRHRYEPLNPEPSELVSDPRLQAVTVRMLLNHTSGLPNWASGPLTFEAAPGTEWHYSGEGYLLLQRAVEAVTGQPLDQFMATTVFAPLGMDHSGFVWNERIAQDLLPGTKADGSAKKTVTITAPIAAFSLHTSAGDYGKFLASVLNDDALLKQITALSAPADRDLGLDWGLGWGIEQHPDDSTIWQWGNNPGYRGFVIGSVKRRDGFVMLTNSDNGLVLARPLTQAILGGEHKLFRSSILGTDLVNLLCKTVGLCL